MSKKTRANFMVKDYSHYGCCPPDCTEDGCEFTVYDGITDRPDCRKSWFENLRRNTE